MRSPISVSIAALLLAASAFAALEMWVELSARQDRGGIVTLEDTRPVRGSGSAP